MFPYFLAGGLGYIVVLLKPEFAKYVLTRPESFPRNQFFQKYFPLAGEGLLVAGGEHHRYQKRLLGKAFSMIQMKYYVPVFNRHANVLIEV